MFQINKFKGVGVALVTPFKIDKSIDFDAYNRILNHVIEGGVNFLVVMGTTGEAPTIDFSERQEIIEFTKEQTKGNIPIVIGIGGNNTAHLINQLESYDLDGVDAILSSSPNYNKPSQEGIFKHYEVLSKNTQLPLILYNVPGRTSSNISAKTTLRLANDFENIIAIKEASGDLVQCMEIAKNKPSDFLLISGDDILTLPMISFGASGVISVIANALPKSFCNLIQNGLKGNFEIAKKEQLNLLDIMNAIFLDGNPGGIKAALNHLGICKEELRLPLVPVNESIRNKIINEVRKIKGN